MCPWWPLSTLAWASHLPVQETWDRGLITESGRSPAGGNGNPLQYSFLGHPTDRGAWQATVHRVTQSQTWLKQLSTHAHVWELLSTSIYHPFLQSHHVPPGPPDSLSNPALTVITTYCKPPVTLLLTGSPISQWHLNPMDSRSSEPLLPDHHSLEGWIQLFLKPLLFIHIIMDLGFPGGSAQRRQWHPTPVLLPGKSHGWRSLVGCSPWGC